ncbi:MAG TPA: YciI family protein, partial [Polyangiaceae bacterium]|nr:YciI family protein [Polyangiaceae bacterium]
MRFMVLVKSNQASETGALPDERELSEMGAYNDSLIAAGAMLGGEGLKPSSEGRRVRITSGKARTHDGPFAEAKELVGGYWIVKFESRDEAIRWLKRAPFVEGEVELRPLYEPSDFALPEDGTPPPPDAPPPARKPGTRRYLSMLKADAYTEAGCAPTPELLAEMGGLMQEMTQRGVLLMGEGLKPSRDGARIVYEGKQSRVVDGPFT